MSLRDDAKRATRATKRRGGRATKEREEAAQDRAADFARAALSGVLGVKPDQVTGLDPIPDEHPKRIETKRPTYRYEQEDVTFKVRPVGGEGDFARPGGYEVFVVLEDSERVVTSLADLGEVL